MMRVLVMEPDSANRRQLRALLERNGFEVFETTTAAGARQAQANRVLTVIADVALLADADLMAIADPIPVVIVTDSPSVTKRWNACAGALPTILRDHTNPRQWSRL